ncbi:MAG: hypothetical protein KDJ34_18110 [Candidatus Competibacteraceae bacterium]|nr:hypothetical protein [Candidatus Competibacteraceae bacterium]
MMNGKVKKLALAVGVALGGVSMVPTAQAVSAAQDNIGQALIFPYYTVNSGWMSLFGVTNTSANIVAVKVRFREAYNSRDVLDFNVILSPHDVWTGWVAETANGPTIFSEDTTCTVGTITSSGVPFPSPTSYVGSAVDGGPTTVARMNEGYVEMIMMGAADPTSSTTLPTTALARGAIHSTTTGVPPGCAALVNAFQDTTKLDQLRQEFSVSMTNLNPLSGTFSLVNGAEGYSAAGKPVALANFFSSTTAGCTTNTTFGECNLMTLQLSQAAAGDFYRSWHEPSLSAANTFGVKLGTTSAAGAGETAITGALTGAAAVTAALTHTQVINEWTRRTNPAAGWTTASDWVVTFPTKNFYVDNKPSTEFAGRASGRANIAAALPVVTTAPTPFAQFFVDTVNTPNVTTRGQSCDSISIALYNREEAMATGGGFSPGGTPQLCYEANVLTFAGSNILNSAIPASVDSLSGTFGWMNIGFSPAVGLPAVGFSITSRDDTNSALLSEAGLVEHSYVAPTTLP